MPIPSEHKTVQARILTYVEVIGWTLVSREEAEQWSVGFPTRQADKKVISPLDNLCGPGKSLVVEPPDAQTEEHKTVQARILK